MRLRPCRLGASHRPQAAAGRGEQSHSTVFNSISVGPAIRVCCVLRPRHGTEVAQGLVSVVAASLELWKALCALCVEYPLCPSCSLGRFDSTFQRCWLSIYDHHVCASLPLQAWRSRARWRNFTDWWNISLCKLSCAHTCQQSMPVAVSIHAGRTRQS